LYIYSLERKEFDSVFLAVAYDVLRRILGEAVVKIIYRCLERRDGIRWKEIPRSIEELGSSADILKRLMIKRLCSKLQLEYGGNPEIGFVGQIRTLRKRFEEKKT